MKALLPKRNQWPVWVLVALAVVFAGNEAALGQRGGVPRPGGFAPGRPPVQQPRQPTVPQPRQNPKFVEVTIYRCSRCNAQVGSGPTPPALAICPNCGAQFGGGSASILSRSETDSAEEGDFASLALPAALAVGFAVVAGVAIIGLIRYLRRRKLTPIPDPIPEVE